MQKQKTNKQQTTDIKNFIMTIDVVYEKVWQFMIT